MDRIRCYVAILLSAFALQAAQAAPFGWVTKGTKARAVASSAVLGRLSKQQVIAGASVIGAGVVYVELRGGKLALEGIDQASGAVIGNVDELAKLTAGLEDLAPTKRQPKYVMAREDAVELGAKLDLLLAQGVVYVVEPVMGPLRVVSQVMGGSPSYFKQLGRGLLTPIDSRLSESVAEALAAPARREQLLIYPMYASTEVDALQRLASAAGDRLIDARRFPTLPADHAKGKTVVAVGHIEDSAFVARGADGKVIRMQSIDTLEALAAKHDIQLVSAGCSSYCAGARAGYPSAITDADVADSVRAAFEAKTMADLLGAFGAKHPLIVSQDALIGFANSRTLDLAALDSYSKPVGAGAMTIRLRSAAAEKSGMELGALGAWYVIGLIFSVCAFRTSRDAFLNRFPRLPSPVLPRERPRYLLGLAGRGLLLATFAPVFGAITVLTFFFGGWPHRRSILIGLWDCVRHPIRGSLNVLLALACWLVAVLAYGLAAAALFVPPLMLTVEAWERSDHPLFWLYALGCAAYWCAALWGGVKLYKRVDRWLDARANASLQEAP